MPPSGVKKKEKEKIMFELKFRRKGKEEVFEMKEELVPKILTPKKGVEDQKGIDLTGYPVIFASYGKRGDQKALKLHEEIPHVIIIYQYEWYNGYGEGIFLPEKFNPYKVKFFKSQSQVVAEARKEKKEIVRNICEEVEKLLYKEWFFNIKEDVIEVYPRQEVSIDCYWWKAIIEIRKGVGVDIKKIERILREKVPLWEKWNKKGVYLFKKYTGETPQKGGISIYYRRKMSEDCKPRMELELDLNTGWWLVLEEKEGEWVEVETTHK